MEGGGGGAVVLLRIIGGGCVTRFSTSWPYFRPKHVISHTRFKTWPLKSIPVFKPGGSHKTQHTCLRRQKLDHHYWGESANKKNIFLKIYFEFAQYGVMLFTGWEVRIVRNCARGRRPRAVLRPTADRPRPVNNILIFFLLRFKSFRKILLQPPTYVCWRRARSCWCYSKRAIDCKPKQNITTWFLTRNLY